MDPIPAAQFHVRRLAVTVSQAAALVSFGEHLQDELGGTVGKREIPYVLGASGSGPRSCSTPR